jgi:predicted nucleic acid-binding protein
MILVDAGPLIALIDRGEPDHERCVETLSSLTAPMVTTWPAFTEAMYLLGSAGGWKAQEALWKLIDRGDLQLAPLDDAGQGRAQALMAKYKDMPMDLADATLVAAAEALGLTRIFTLDRDFQVYRWRGKRKFEVIP